MENLGGTVGNIYFIFFGAFLTFLSTAIIEFWKNRSDRNERKQNFLLIIKLGLVSIQKTLEKLKSGLDYRNYFEFSILDILDRNLKNLEGTQREAYYLPDQEKQEKFIDLVSEITTYSSDLRAIENLYSTRERELLELINNKKTEPKVSRSKTKNLVEGNTPQEQYKNLIEFINKKRQEKVIDLVDLKRRLDEFIKSIES